MKPKRYSLNKRICMLVEESDGHFETHEEAEQSRKDAERKGYANGAKDGKKWWSRTEHYDAPAKDADKEGT